MLFYFVGLLVSSLVSSSVCVSSLVFCMCVAVAFCFGALVSFSPSSLLFVLCF